jgi:hypothetical protein
MGGRRLAPGPQAQRGAVERARERKESEDRAYRGMSGAYAGVGIRDNPPLSRIADAAAIAVHKPAATR